MKEEERRRRARTRRAFLSHLLSLLTPIPLLPLLAPIALVLSLFVFVLLFPLCSVSSYYFDMIPPFSSERFMSLTPTKVKLALLRQLSDKTMSMIAGTTDTEHIGALFIEYLGKDPHSSSVTIEEMKAAMFKTIQFVVRLTKKFKTKLGEEIESELSSSLNLAVTDGKRVVATRYRNHPTDVPPSLYYNISSSLKLKGKSICLHSLFILSCAPLSSFLLCLLFVSLSLPLSHSSTPSPATSLSHLFFPLFRFHTKSEESKSLDLQPIRLSAENKPHEDDTSRICVISSEPLTYHAQEWALIPPNHIIWTDDESFEIRMSPIHIGTVVERCFRKWKAYKKPSLVIHHATPILA
jgi:hypothetical protein